LLFRAVFLCHKAKTECHVDFNIQLRFVDNIFPNSLSTYFQPEHQHIHFFQQGAVLSLLLTVSTQFSTVRDRKIGFNVENCL